MELAAVVSMVVLGTVIPWFLDAHLKLRKRVADLERHAGVGRPDPVADLLDESPGR